MDNTVKGIGAGFIATVVMSVLMLIKSAMKLMPELDPIATNSGLASRYLGMADTPSTGWGLHFIVGTIIFGIIFGAWNHLVPGKTELGKGLWFGIIVWLLSMIVVSPIAGAGFFGANLGIEAPIATFVLHLIYGAVLGYSYAKMMHVSATRTVLQV